MEERVHCVKESLHKVHVEVPVHHTHLVRNHDVLQGVVEEGYLLVLQFVVLGFIIELVKELVLGGHLCLSQREVLPSVERDPVFDEDGVEVSMLLVHLREEVLCHATAHTDTRLGTQPIAAPLRQMQATNLQLTLRVRFANWCQLVSTAKVNVDKVGLLLFNRLVVHGLIGLYSSAFSRRNSY